MKLISNPKILISTLILSLLAIAYLTSARPLYLLFIKDNIDLGSKLTEGSWIKTIGPKSQSQSWVYTFTPNGEYTNQFYSDYMHLTKGAWKIVVDVDGRKQLVLTTTDQSDCYILPCKTYIEYDPIANKLLFSGADLNGAWSLKPNK